MAGTSSEIIICPQCGKPFKRLKTHLPHCKMAVKEKTTQIPRKDQSLSAIAVKPRSVKTQPNGNEKKNRMDLPAIAQAKPAGVAKKGKTEVARKSEKAEHMESECPASIKTNKTLIEKGCNETKRPVKVSKKTVKGLLQKKKVLCNLIETTHSKERDSPDAALLNHIEGQFVLDTGGAMMKMIVKVPSPDTVVLPNRTDLFIRDAIKPQTSANGAALIPPEKQQFALLPTTAVQCPIQRKQTSIPELSGRSNPSNSNSLNTKWSRKDLHSEDSSNAEAVSLAGTIDQRDALHTAEGEQCEKMNTLHLDEKAEKASLWNRETERGGSVMKTSLWDDMKDSMLKGTIRSLGDTSFKQKLEPEFRALAEDTLLNDSAEKLIPSSDSVPILQRIGHIGTCVDTGQERGRSATYVVCLQQVPENEQHKTLPISSRYPLEDGDGEVLIVQKNGKTSCVGTHSKLKPAYLQETVSKNNIQMDSLGLQWLPEFYSSYQELGVIPGKCHKWDGNISSREYVCHQEQHLVPPSERRLMNVALGELPFWLSARIVSGRDIAGAAQRVWGRYNNKYINVKRGGIGGITMLLAGYCILSYAWNYNHIKRDRWRKYH